MKLDAGKLHNRIREHRAILNITQDELARQTGVSRQTIISIERGKYNPSVVLALKIADALKVPVEILFSLENST